MKWTEESSVAIWREARSRLLSFLCELSPSTREEMTDREGTKKAK